MAYDINTVYIDVIILIIIIIVVIITNIKQIGMIISPRSQNAGKLLCNKMVLKRCTSIEHLWNRKLASLTSTELWEIFLLWSDRRWRADMLKRPESQSQTSVESETNRRVERL